MGNSGFYREQRAKLVNSASVRGGYTILIYYFCFLIYIGAQGNAFGGADDTKLKMPLEFKLAPPVEGWYYKGQFDQEAGGPLGAGERSIRTSLTIGKSPNFPAPVTFRMDANRVVIRHPDHTSTIANPNNVPKLTTLANLKMDEYGHVSGRYNPDEFPLCLISDLWPLPPKPMDDDEDYIEKVERTDEKGVLRYKGTRKITLHTTSLFDGVPCAIMGVYTNLDGQYSGEPETRPLELNIESHFAFNMQANWPRSIHLDMTYAGNTRQKDGSLRGFDWLMEWDLHRHKLKPPKPPRAEPAKPAAAMLSVTAGEPIRPVSVKLAGVQLVRYVDKKRGIRPFYRQKKGYSLWLILELSEADLIVVNGQVNKAVTNAGENILPRRERNIPFPRLCKDKKAAQFDIELSLPDANTTALAEVSGALYCLKSTGTRKIDLGLMEFKAGTKSELQDCSIDSIRVKEWHKGYTYMRLKANLPRGSVKQVRFYHRDGTEIEVSRGGWSYTQGRIRRMEFKTKGQFPAKGRIVIEALDNITKHEIPFRLTNISLLGSESRKESQPPDFDLQMDLNRTPSQKLQPPPTEPEKGADSVGPLSGLEVIKPVSAKVGGVLLVRYFDKKRGIRPFNRQIKGYTLCLILELPEAVTKNTRFQINKALTERGQNLLPEHKHVTGSNVYLSKDKKAAMIEIELSNPDADTTALAEVSGALSGLNSSGTRKIEIGLMEFKAGAKSKVPGFSIKSVEKRGEEHSRITLKPDLSRDTLVDARFYRPDGTEIEVHRRGTWSSRGRILSIGYETKGSFPPKGRIVFEVLDNVTKFRIPFELTNISLLGQQL